jgi:hypothetical protein
VQGTPLTEPRFSIIFREVVSMAYKITGKIFCEFLISHIFILWNCLLGKQSINELYEQEQKVPQTIHAILSGN